LRWQVLALNAVFRFCQKQLTGDLNKDNYMPPHHLLFRELNKRVYKNQSRFVNKHHGSKSHHPKDAWLASQEQFTSFGQHEDGFGAML
jgi:hypothetical protein